jgi:hypothetical protein
VSARRRRAWPRLAAILAVAIAAAGGACGGGPPTTAAPPVASPTTDASTGPTPEATASPALASTSTPTEAGPAVGPPAALLAVEGGDAVEGSLGTYIWADGGSDSPWLHGAPTRVGARESLVLTFRPPAPIAGWSARYVPADASGPAGAVSLGEGDAGPSFALPPPGSWTVELIVTFADGLGEAHYFWQVDVT